MLLFNHGRLTGNLTDKEERHPSKPTTHIMSHTEWKSLVITLCDATIEPSMVTRHAAKHELACGLNFGDRVQVWWEGPSGIGGEFHSGTITHVMKEVATYKVSYDSDTRKLYDFKPLGCDNRWDKLDPLEE